MGLTCCGHTWSNTHWPLHHSWSWGQTSPWCSSGDTTTPRAGQQGHTWSWASSSGHTTSPWQHRDTLDPGLLPQDIPPQPDNTGTMLRWSWGKGEKVEASDPPCLFHAFQRKHQGLRVKRRWSWITRVSDWRGGAESPGFQTEEVEVKHQGFRPKRTIWNTRVSDWRGGGKTPGFQTEEVELNHQGFRLKRTIWITRVSD